MKIILTLYLICCAYLFSNAQNVRPYLAIVKTFNGKQKGILSFVDSDQLILRVDKKYVYIPYSKIKSIRLRVQKKDFEYKELVPYTTNWVEDRYETLPNGQQVLKPGKEAPSLGESIAEPFVNMLMTSVVNLAANGLLRPFHEINPSLATFKNTRENPLTPEKILELRYFSTNYQINPDYIAEAQKIKALTKNFKP
ncbi:LSm family protein [Pedobacter endophyticus]|uniref:DUF4369 domain-containing protein n=1 Tax=Pedobacter endophyticus TaxID=2789740 RepID=A0A7S9KZF1_9SPHI|nr:hypothetical protein [Pedobacter endophyticus]QPH39677.1 hypothetical protein IZT61_22020 [Pedobacter endophyticus]